MTRLFKIILICGAIFSTQAQASEGDGFLNQRPPFMLESSSPWWTEIPMPWAMLDGVWEVETPHGLMHLRIRIDNNRDAVKAHIDYWISEVSKETLIDSSDALSSVNDKQLVNHIMWNDAQHRVEIKAYRDSRFPPSKDVVINVKVVRVSSLRPDSAESVIVDRQVSKLR